MSKSNEEFEKLTQALALEAQSANLDHQLWRNLTSTPERHETEFNQSRVFWQMTFEAHFNSCLFRLCRLYDHQKCSFNLGRWLAIIKNNPNWFTSAAYKSCRPGSEYSGPPDPTQLAADIDYASYRTNPLVKNLTKFRSNVLAHMGRDYVLRDKGAPAIFKMTYGDVKTLVKQAIKIINRYTQIYNGHTYSPNMTGLDDFSFILEAVRERVQRLRGEK